MVCCYQSNVAFVGGELVWRTRAEAALDMTLNIYRLVFRDGLKVSDNMVSTIPQSLTT